MRRFSGWWWGVTAAGLLVATACGDDDTTSADDGGDAVETGDQGEVEPDAPDAEAEAEAEVVPDVEPDVEPDAEPDATDVGDAEADVCVPGTCETLGVDCGFALDDGCGGTVDCTTGCECSDVLDCAPLPCQVAASCTDGMCVHEAVSCGTPAAVCDVTTVACLDGSCTGDEYLRACGTESCPAAYCDPAPELVGSELVYGNRCVALDAAPCGTCLLGRLSCRDPDGLVCDDLEAPAGGWGSVECDSTVAATTFLYVDSESTAGTSADGSRARPYPTYAAALSAIDAGRHSSARAVLVGGASVFTTPLQVRDGLSIYGGFARGTWQVQALPAASVRPLWSVPASAGASGRLVGAVAHAIHGATVLSNLEVRTADYTGNTADIGNSNYGLHAHDAWALELRYVRVQAGGAGAGSNGTNGTAGTAGAAGGSGADGDYLGSSCDWLSPPGAAGGSGGAAPATCTTGGSAGSGGNGGSSPNSQYPGWAAGAAGTASSSGAAGGAGGTSTYGASGAAGTAGSAGTGGSRGATGQTTTADGYLNPTGTGGTGASGNPGGGGGGGASGQTADFVSCYSGGGGGGGGAGGCPGTAGTGGRPGGFSLALVAHNCENTTSGEALTTRDCTFVAGNGGAGGRGGNAGTGGTGGAGGAGGLRHPLGSANGTGGSGGSGGAGGTGGGGGGGAGGLSVGVYCSGTHVDLTDSTATAGTSGAGGAAGTPNGTAGQTPAPLGSSGCGG